MCRSCKNYNYIGSCFLTFYLPDTQCDNVQLDILMLSFDCVNKSFKSLFHNTIGKNGSQYTVNKLTYIHSLYINKYNDI